MSMPDKPIVDNDGAFIVPEETEMYVVHDPNCYERGLLPLLRIGPFHMSIGKLCPLFFLFGTILGLLIISRCR